MKKTIIYQNILIIDLFLFGMLFMQSCDGEGCEESTDYASRVIQIEVERVENQLYNLQSREDVLQFLENHRVLADHFLYAHEYPNDTILANRLYRLLGEASIDTLIDETKVYFADFDRNIEELERAYRFIKYHYPETKIPKIQTIITGFYNDMFISDSLLIIGLDYFVGAKGRYHPNDIPSYIASRYMKESLTPIILSFVSNAYNQPDESHGTLLADMVNLGKSYYFVKKAMPCIPDSLIVGYSSEDIRLVKENQEIIWASLIENEMLYETNHFLRNKFVGERPNIPEIGRKCPGRVGAWVGWQIVKRYMENNPNVTFKELMAEKDAHKIFQKASYKPRAVAS